MEVDYCGCCGNEADPGIVYQIGPWCVPCTAHIAFGGPWEECTYFALYDKDCPYQVGGPILTGRNHG